MIRHCSLAILSFIILFSAGLHAENEAMALHPGHEDIGIMAPLLVGDPHHLESSDSVAAWTEFARQLRVAKELGAQYISVDVWWGLVEPKDGVFEWSYYRKMFRYITGAGLMIKPIFSFHQLGGNVGDRGYIPLADWVWTKAVGLPGVKDATSLMIKSEQGNLNREAVGPWGTRFVIGDYTRTVYEFQREFADLASFFHSFSVGLGPAGEGRLASYGVHDTANGYGTRGSLQIYSDLAIASFREYVRQKYQTIARLNAAWGTHLADFTKVNPPDPRHLTDFFAREQQFTPYGRDLFNWQNRSLLESNEMVVNAVMFTFNTGIDPAFRGIPISAKIPGIHWRVGSDRLAELHAGLIRSRKSTWSLPTAGYGYAPLLDSFKRMFSKPYAPRGCYVDFTAIELSDGRDGPAMASQARSLAVWIANYAQKIGLKLEGENALGFELHKDSAWHNMIELLTETHYSGVTLLRLDEIVTNETAMKGLRKLVRALHAHECRDELLKAG